MLKFLVMDHRDLTFQPCPVLRVERESATVGAFEAQLHQPLRRINRDVLGRRELRGAIVRDALRIRKAFVRRLRHREPEPIFIQYLHRRRTVHLILLRQDLIRFPILRQRIDVVAGDDAWEV
jgi:hypothetical protein